MHSAGHATVLVGLLLACFAAVVAARDADAGADTLVVDRADDSLTTACTSATNDCTFRGAMNRAYTNPASVARIEFRIPLAGTQIITTLTPLDVIGGPMEIDGTTQAEVDASCTVDEDGQPCIVLDGAGQGNHGIIGGTDSQLTIRGLSIIRFERAIWFPAGGDHIVVGNYLGTLDGSSFSLANGNDTGVYVDTGIPGVRIGGPSALERNVISANDYGIVTNEGDLNIVVQGNYIGTTADGSTALGNRGAGITFSQTTASLIGGDGTGEGNVISANGFPLDSAGILILNSTDIDVQGNLIGTNAAGTAALGNKTAGVVVAAGSIRTTIGGSGSAGNVISGNASNGVRLDSAGDDSFVRGNRIGTNVAGNAAIPNMGSGVVILNIPGADIGGHEPENGNLISGNGSDGIEIGGLNQNIFIYRNYIGVTADGESALGNADYGISEFATGTATDNTSIGDNVISANGVDGIHLFVSNLIFGSDLTDQVIKGNMVGTDASGSDPLHNGRDAIAIQGVAGAGIYSNTISVADGNRGIFLSSATGSFVQQNYIGTNAAGDDLNGGSVGIKVAQGANNHIGGLSLNPTAMGLGAAAGGNTIRNADTYGVHIEDPGSVGNTISGNSINDNGSLGIYLSNFGNGQEPAPVLASAVAGSTHVMGSLQSTPNQTFTIEFFSSPACDDSGAGEGQDYLGSATANTNPAGLAVIDATLTTDAPGGSAVTATTTDPTGNTSQFSNCVTMVGPTPTPSPTPSPTPTPTPSGTVTPTPSGAPLLGDGDCDGEVDLDDVIAALSEFGGVDPGADCADLADVDCDDDVDGKDALRILLFVAGTPMTPVVACGQVGT